jgi:hypothetical protein
MKFRKELGSEAVRELILEASARAATVPDTTVRDPWPSDRRLEAESAVRSESTQEDK